MEEDKCIVYYDEKYPSSWIKKDDAEKIANFLENFRIKNAEELADFMNNCINKENAYGKLVVFSQDVIPYTIAKEYSADRIGYTSSTPFREFLDQGGSVLWIGDIPGASIGIPGENTLKPEALKIGAPVLMFGVVPIFADSVKATVIITKFGKKLGLKHKWSGIRPILPERRRGIKWIAKSEAIIGKPYISNILSKESVKKLGKKRKIGGGVNTPLGEGKIEMETNPSIEGKYLYEFFHRTFPNAWFKNYNKDYPNSGFYRIWDYRPRINEQMNKELLTIINSILARLK